MKLTARALAFLMLVTCTASFCPPKKKRIEYDMDKQTSYPTTKVNVINSAPSTPTTPPPAVIPPANRPACFQAWNKRGKSIKGAIPASVARSIAHGVHSPEKTSSNCPQRTAPEELEAQTTLFAHKNNPTLGHQEVELQQNIQQPSLPNQILQNDAPPAPFQVTIFGSTPPQDAVKPKAKNDVFALEMMTRKYMQQYSELNQQ